MVCQLYVLVLYTDFNKITEAFTQAKQLLSTASVLGQTNTQPIMTALFSLSPSELNVLLPKFLLLFQSNMSLLKWLTSYFHMHADYPIWNYDIIKKEMGQKTSLLLSVTSLPLLLAHAFFPSSKGDTEIFLDDIKVRNCLLKLMESYADASNVISIQLFIEIINISINIILLQLLFLLLFLSTCSIGESDVKPIIPIRPR